MQIVIDVPEDIYEYVKKTIISNEIFDELVDAFRNGTPLPPVEPKRKTGKWHVEGFNVWCTSCGFHPTAIEVFNYCPNCGAKMEVD